MSNIFPRRSNLVPLEIAVCLGALAFGVAAGVAYYATPKAQRVGYQPSQPIPFDHSLHVGQLGLDCRYCHSFVDQAGHSNVPTSNTCWNCHQHVKRDSPRLKPLHEAMDENDPGYTGKPIEWVRIHKSPDYVYFNHSAHVNSGVSCQTCHGDVQNMKVVYQAESHSMGWCLECHRAPEKFLRPIEEVYNMDYDVETYIANHPDLGVQTQEDLGLKLKEQWNINPKESCATCHH